MGISHNELVAFLAEAAYNHSDDVWAKRVVERIPDLAQRYTPPCPGYFDTTAVCVEYHSHTLDCGAPMDICKKCGKINAEHVRR